jgi:hypothetical protein
MNLCCLNVAHVSRTEWGRTGTTADPQVSIKICMAVDLMSSRLFTLGYFQVNMDGSYMTDPDSGLPLPTYSNDNIEDFARIWTGYDTRETRGNLISGSRQGGKRKGHTVKWNEELTLASLVGQPHPRVASSVEMAFKMASLPRENTQKSLVCIQNVSKLADWPM